ncbi:glycosyltransferase family 4 protein [Erythrobacter sp. YT30]|uniref:glycosyltransferase family 4 protein n=1 Tax=Erythrobacter sp. YT30 TaxID=1735012 RepID=UPI00076D13B8|nr:glycosyltransferase family 4 protein [Erythrobacter sp. YT30]KWV92895.1 glycosyl transferase [Erythrobacter sp. YT30]
MKIVVLSSLAFSLINFRGQLLAEMRRAGHQVVAVAPDDDPRVREKLGEMGIDFKIVPMARTGTNPIADLQTISAYVSLLKREEPDVVVAYTQKPIIYGGIAGRIAGIKRYYALMSGLGYLFSEAAEGRNLLKKVFCRLYRSGLANAQRIFVFNSDDKQDMLDAGIIDGDAPVLQVPGSGVDLERFVTSSAPDSPIRFLMIGRLMRDKGIWEYAEAAKTVNERFPEARFSLIGRPEPANPTGLNEADVERLKQDYPIEVIPETNDVPSFLAESHVFVLPTYYREGLPRTILEALAVGRAVITTDMPGCRDAVSDGENGFLVEPRSASSLADAMAKLAADKNLVKKMGAHSRHLAETVYDVRLVNKLLMDEMSLSRPADAPDTSTRVSRQATKRRFRSERSAV